MSDEPKQTDLTSTCSSLARRALSGAAQIRSVLPDIANANDSEAAEHQRLRQLSRNLQQLSADVDRLQNKLREAPVISPKLQEVLSTRLLECDSTAATVLKELARLEKSTPREAISVASISQYEAFVDATIQFVSFATELLDMYETHGRYPPCTCPLLTRRCVMNSGLAGDQEEKLRATGPKSALARVAPACQGIAQSGGLLFDMESSEPHALSQKDESGTLPPAYEVLYPPPSAAQDHLPEVGSSSSGGDGNPSPPGSFLSSLGRPFAAALTALRPKPEPLVSALCDAARSYGTVHQLKSLLNEGANIDGRNEDGKTALICAVLAGQLGNAEFLVMAGADRSACDAGGSGKPPLFHAIETENVAMIELLLQHGADIHQKHPWGQPYFANVIAGKAAPKMIGWLLAHGADAGVKDTWDRTAVVLAVRKRKDHEDCEEVVDILLKHGANPNSTDTDGTPLIYMCATRKHDKLVHRLLSAGADPSARDISGTPLLVTALKNNDQPLVRALLERGADPNAPDIYGTAPVIIALCDSKLPAADRETLAEMLLQHGAHGNKKDFYDITALEHVLEGPASGSSKLKISKLLLNQGANPNQRLTKVADEPTLLIYAADRGHADLAEMALKHGADPNLADKRGRTPLLSAVLRGDEQLVALLLQHGARANQTGTALPVEVAMAGGGQEIVRLLNGVRN
jgi:ankyrin repeat protein